MDYDVMSNPLKKVLNVTGSTVASSQNMRYLYGGSKPNAVMEISDNNSTMSYTYDANGNPTEIACDTMHRQLQWDEENRLMSVDDDGYLSRYTYDANGQRAIRSHGPVEAVYVNGAPQGINYHDEENYTLYISPYATMTSDRFTKHYYAGTRRIASKLGIGEFDNIYGVNNKHLTAGNKDYTERMMQMETGRQHHYKANRIPPGVPTQKGQTGEPEILGTALPNVPLGNYDVPDGWPTPPHFNQPGDVPGPPVQWEEPEDELAEPGYGYVADTTAERDIYYFHSDHLGSTAYLTDRNGEVTQFVCYMPYGETLVDEHTTTYENPFKFSGKELDEIGARSRDPRVTMWLNIDPLFEKYPDYSPYNYCAGNPVKLVDLDGRSAKITINESESTITVDCNIIITGANASDELAKKYQDAIMDSWGSMTDYKDGDKTYSIKWNVKVSANSKLKDKDRNYNGVNNYFTVFDKINSRGRSSSFVRNTDRGEIRGSDVDNANPMPHEFGHILGLRDRYVTNSQALIIGADFYGRHFIGWEGNVMAEAAGKGVVENKNLNRLFPSLFNEHNNSFFHLFFNSSFFINESNRERPIGHIKVINTK